MLPGKIRLQLQPLPFDTTLWLANEFEHLLFQNSFAKVRKTRAE
jgi:hypothetical protein